MIGCIGLTIAVVVTGESNQKTDELRGDRRY
jgi:hypothetical protein